MALQDADGVPINLTLSMVSEKEAELAKRREDIRRMQNRLPASAGPEPNFPPRFMCVKPIVYHNIKEQVPVPLQSFMNALIVVYFVLVALISYNITVALVCLIFGGGLIHFGVSFVYLLGIPGAFIVWYYNVYLCAVDELRSRRLVACVGLWVGIILDVWMAVGVPGLGGCGWIMALLERNMLGFLLSIICASLWSLHALTLFSLTIKFMRMPIGIDNSAAE
uniref:Putative membrane-trafficking protein n=1 Tax=Trypanosoma congolense (strain IL3000) TaxID=1068625 RepID=G0UU96_TRYCI|nr:putative membrane-trafficking protein [Trypanosoma congolense IL3000]